MKDKEAVRRASPFMQRRSISRACVRRREQLIRFGVRREIVPMILIGTQTSVLSWHLCGGSVLLA